MRTSISLKLIGLVALAIFTSTVTSSLLAQSRRAPRRAAGAAPAAATPKGTTVINNGSQPEAQLGVPMEPTAVYTLEHFDIAVNGNQVGVSARVSIMETRPNIGNLWSIRVYDATPAKRLLSEHRYVDQIFATSETENTAPTFSDKLTLEPGDYRVEFVLYSLPNANPSVLTDEAASRSFRASSGVRSVTIN